MSEQAANAFNSHENPGPDIDVHEHRLNIMRQSVIAAKHSLTGSNTFDLREHQLPFFRKGLDFIHGALDQEDPHLRFGRYILPTGFGKSVLNIALIKASGIGRQDIAPEERPKGILFVPTRALREQSIGEAPLAAHLRGFARFAPEMNVASVKRSGRYVDRALDMRVMTYRYALHAFRRGEIRPGQFELFSHDESHYTLGSATKAMIEELCMGAVNIGFTATPSYDAERHVKKIFPVEIGNMSLVDGIVEHGFLSGVQLFTIRSNDTVTEKSGSRDFTEAEIAHLAGSEERNAGIVKAALHAMKHTNGGKGMIWGVPGDDQIHTRILAELFDKEKHPITQEPIKVETIGCFRPDSQDTLKKFADADDSSIVISISMGGVGTDVHDLRWIIYAKPVSRDGKGKVQLEQYLGRGTRPKTDGSNLLFYQVIDSFRLLECKKQPALAWQLFGLEGPPPEGHVIKRMCEPGSHNPAPRPAPLPLEPFIEPAEHMAVIQDETGLVTNDPVEDLQERVSSKYIARLLNVDKTTAESVIESLGYDFVITKDSRAGDSVTKTYSYEAMIAAQDAIAKDSDVLAAEVANEHGMNSASMAYLLQSLGIQPPRLYERKPEKHLPTLRSYLRRYHVEAIKINLGQQIELNPNHHVTLVDICRMTGKTTSSLNTHLDIHGIRGKLRKLKGREEALVYERPIIEAWWKAYSSAPNFCEDEGFIPLGRLPHKLPILLRAARNLGIPTHYRKRKRHTIDCLPNKDVGAVVGEADKIAAGTSPKPTPEERAVAREAKREKAERLRQQKSDLDIYRQEPSLLAAVEGREYPAPATRVPLAFITNIIPHPVSLALIRSVAQKAGILMPEEGPTTTEAHMIASQLLKEVVQSDANKPARPRQQQEIQKTSEKIGEHTIHNEQDTPTANAATRRPQVSPHFSKHAQALPTISRTPDRVPLGSAAHIAQQPANLLLAFAKHSPHFQEDAIGVTHDNLILADRNTCKLLGYAFKGLSPMSIHWRAVEDIAEDYNIEKASLYAWINSGDYTTRDVQAVTHGGFSMTFCSPFVVKRILETAFTIKGSQTRFRES